ncbi:hypothetical protein [Bacillus sp. RC51]
METEQKRKQHDSFILVYLMMYLHFMVKKLKVMDLKMLQNTFELS